MKHPKWGSCSGPASSVSRRMQCGIERGEEVPGPGSLFNADVLLKDLGSPRWGVLFRFSLGHLNDPPMAGHFFPLAGQ